MRRAAIALIGAVGLCGVTQPVFAQELPAPASDRSALASALFFCQVSAAASQLAEARAADGRFVRFATSEAAAEQQASGQLQAAAETIVAMAETGQAAGVVRTGRSVSTDQLMTAPNSFSAELPAAMFGLQQLSGERDGSFDASYRAFEAALLRRLAHALTTLGKTAGSTTMRATAERQAARVQGALATLDGL